MKPVSAYGYALYILYGGTCSKEHYALYTNLRKRRMQDARFLANGYILCHFVTGL